ncbi:MAG: hypothetical protein ACXW32_04020, partial [Limisphaerales bacterium]
MLKQIQNRIAMLPLLAAAVFFSAPLSHASDFQGATHLVPLDEDAIGYTKSEPDSAISRLQKKLDSGSATLQWDEKFGYLKDVLKLLEVPESSQMLVFSKT